MQQRVQLLVCDVSHPGPPRLVVMVPQSRQAYGDPLPQSRARIWQLFETDADKRTLQGSFLAVTVLVDYARQDKGRLGTVFCLEAKQLLCENTFE